MDPLAHTLAGATLAETRLRDWTPFAAPALILGANAPDVDALTMFVSRDLSLGFRRGWTHGVLAMAVLPFVLTAALLLLDRAIARWRGGEPRARPGPLLALGALAVASHPVLDWLNTYGVRFLMPFDGAWFYGDALFVVDPWIWLLLGASVVLARGRSRVGAAGWIVLGVLTTSLVTGFDGPPAATRLLWCAGVAAIVWLRMAGRWKGRVPRLAAICLSAAALYVAVMVAASLLAERQAAAWLAARGGAPLDVMASPAPGNPLLRQVVAADEERYHFLEVDWLSDDPIRVSLPSIDRGGGHPAARAALTAPHVWGLATWTRFPAFRIEETEGGGYRVSISDVRYAWRGGGLGAAVVELDRDLRVRSPPRRRE